LGKKALWVFGYGGSFSNLSGATPVFTGLCSPLYTRCMQEDRDGTHTDEFT